MFNFTASHDGVGLRALEGLMNDQRIKDLLINCYVHAILRLEVYVHTYTNYA